MIGAIAGDIIGSVYEFQPIKTTEFPLFTSRNFFTDDTVLTVAVADAILGERDYGDAIHEFANRYPGCSYGEMFRSWMSSPTRQPYGSYGNGSAMRVSAVGFAFSNDQEVLREARRSAEVTHDHEEGIRGAQAVALAVYLAKNAVSKDLIRDEISRRLAYDLTRTVDDIRPSYRFDETCQGTVPEAIAAFLEADDYEDAVRKAVSLGGDSDTLACITGGIAEAYWGGVPESIESEVRRRLPEELSEVIDAFRKRFCVVT